MKYYVDQCYLAYSTDPSVLNTCANRINTIKGRIDAAKSGAELKAIWEEVFCYIMCVNDPTYQSHYKSIFLSVFPVVSHMTIDK